jgi:hypothetical protein
LKKLRLEREAAERSATGSRVVMETEQAERQRKRWEMNVRDSREASSSQLDRGSKPRTLSEWLTQQNRDGGRY